MIPPASRWCAIGGASLLNLLLECLLQDFSAEPLAALLRHDLAVFGLAREEARHHASLIEIALLRTGTGAPEIGTALPCAAPCRAKNEEAPAICCSAPSRRSNGKQHHRPCRPHRRRAGSRLLANPPTRLPTISTGSPRPARRSRARPSGWARAATCCAMPSTCCSRSRASSASCDLPRAAAIIRHWLHGLPVRSQQHNPHAARHPGPSRSTPDPRRRDGAGRTQRGRMARRRRLRTLDQPPDARRARHEAARSQIGQTAHDFVQAFGNADVKLLWSRRIGDSPGTPSRWIHRLQMILETAGLKDRFAQARPGRCWRAGCRSPRR